LRHSVYAAHCRPSSVVCWSVGLSVCYTSEPCKTAEPIKMPFGLSTRVSPRGGGCCAAFGRELGPHLTQCGLGRGLPLHQVASSYIQLFFWATISQNGLLCAMGPLCVLYDCLPVTLVIYGQTAGWIKMTLGMEVGLGPGDIMLDEDQFAPTERGTASPHFLADAYCG